jgi:hypothetical protein
MWTHNKNKFIIFSSILEELIQKFDLHGTGIEGNK